MGWQGLFQYETMTLCKCWWYAPNSAGFCNDLSEIWKLLLSPTLVCKKVNKNRIFGCVRRQLRVSVQETCKKSDIKKLNWGLDLKMWSDFFFWVESVSHFGRVPYEFLPTLIYTEREKEKFIWIFVKIYFWSFRN